MESIERILNDTSTEMIALLHSDSSAERITMDCLKKLQVVTSYATEIGQWDRQRMI